MLTFYSSCFENSNSDILWRATKILLQGGGGLEFKVKTLLDENVAIDQAACQTHATQALLLTSVCSRWEIFVIFRKNRNFNAIRIRFCPFS